MSMGPTCSSESLESTCETTHCWHKTTIWTFTTMKTWNFIVWFCYFNRIWDSSVGTMICYRLDNWDLIPGRATDFFPLHSIETGSGYRVFHSLGVKCLGCKAVHLPPSSIKFKNDAPIPPLFHMSAWQGAQLSTGTLILGDIYMSACLKVCLVIS